VSSSRFLSQAGRSFGLDVFALRVGLDAFDTAFFARGEVDEDAKGFLRVEV